jgi:hypothetical protein
MAMTTAERVQRWRDKQRRLGRCVICGGRASRRGGVVRRKCPYHLDLDNERKRKRAASN